MTKEEKQLLLVDLCARLPYNVKIKFASNKDIEKINNLIYVSDNEPSYIHNSCMVLTEDNIKYVFNDWFDEYKPYLRPMSSITDEEKAELKDISARYIDEWENTKTPEEKWALGAKTSYISAEFYNSHHLDWNGLIDKGLALEAPEGMYNITK